MRAISTFASKLLPWGRSSHASQEPGVAMFRGLRVRLTLWYSAVLAVALVLFGIALYVIMQYLLFEQVRQSLDDLTNMQAGGLRGNNPHACSPGPPAQPTGRAFELV